MELQNTPGCIFKSNDPVPNIYKSRILAFEILLAIFNMEFIILIQQNNQEVILVILYGHNHSSDTWKHPERI